MSHPGDHSAACEVWWAMASGRGELEQLLDAAERRRADRLRRPQARQGFVTARALLRLILSGRTGVHPLEVRLDTTCYRCGADHGKPRLLGGRPPVQFSVAHAADSVVVAVTDDDVALGVDVEVVMERDPQNLTALASSFLAPAETADLLHLEPSARSRSLAVLWTRKEAVLKATGDGLTLAMSDVVVTAANEPAGLRTTGRGEPAMVRLHDLPSPDRTVACLAAVGVRAVDVSVHDGDALLAAGSQALRAGACAP